MIGVPVGRNAAFREDDETHQALRTLGYTPSEIGRTAGSLPSEMATEDKLRLSLRALSAEHSTEVSERAEQQVESIKPKNTPNAEPPPESDAYWQGRKDEKALGRPSVSGPKPKAGPAPRKAADPAKAAMRDLKNIQRLAKVARGKKATARPRRPYR